MAMPRLINQSGQRFGKLILISKIKTGLYPCKDYWLCLCDCGNTHEARAGKLNSNYTKQCKSCRTAQQIKSNTGKKRFKTRITADTSSFVKALFGSSFRI